ncbi:MAG: hypothetical protein KBF58_08710 [Methyloversatilis sp.]|jgi:hypothetical protein|nr:hypothetical protein [Methyloversatilis sp.]MBP6194322.1 hypothetical protein [Methyloversatilis sp.]MBP9118149.1 hypothetical protein [Methyloversatilis sp.]
MRNNDRPDDDEEGDISDDPVLSAIDTDLESVSRRNDNQLLAILVLLVPMAVLYERSDLKSIWLDAAFLGLLFGAVGFTIFRVVRQKQKVAAKYGLACRVCGGKPRAHMVLSAAMTRHCARCGARLNG